MVAAPPAPALNAETFLHFQHKPIVHWYKPQQLTENNGFIEVYESETGSYGVHIGGFDTAPENQDAGLSSNSSNITLPNGASVVPAVTTTSIALRNQVFQKLSNEFREVFEYVMIRTRIAEAEYIGKCFNGRLQKHEGYPPKSLFSDTTCNTDALTSRLSDSNDEGPSPSALPTPDHGIDQTAITTGNQQVLRPTPALLHFEQYLQTQPIGRQLHSSRGQGPPWFLQGAIDSWLARVDSGSPLTDLITDDNDYEDNVQHGHGSGSPRS